MTVGTLRPVQIVVETARLVEFSDIVECRIVRFFPFLERMSKNVVHLPGSRVSVNYESAISNEAALDLASVKFVQNAIVVRHPGSVEALLDVPLEQLFLFFVFYQGWIDGDLEILELGLLLF